MACVSSILFSLSFKIFMSFESIFFFTFKRENLFRNSIHIFPRFAFNRQLFSNKEQSVVISLDLCFFI